MCTHGGVGELLLSYGRYVIIHVYNVCIRCGPRVWKVCPERINISKFTDRSAVMLLKKKKKPRPVAVAPFIMPLSLLCPRTIIILLYFMDCRENRLIDNKRSTSTTWKCVRHIIYNDIELP